MITVLHGYLLEGSGSNLWTRATVQSLCESGETVHLMCQENHPDLYDFISDAILYKANGKRETLLKRKPIYPGRCIMHKPHIGETLPVYVKDKYEEFSDVRPMVELSDGEIETYLRTNVKILQQIVDENEIKVILANHAVLMSVVAQRVGKTRNIPYAIMPHGSAIEYAVKKDRRYFNYAESAFAEAQRIYVIGKEMRERLKNLFTKLPQIEDKMKELNLGVNTSLFNPIKREERKDNIGKLCLALEKVPRGKTGSQQSMPEQLTADISKRNLLSIIHASSSYHAKFPDDNVEEKLQMVEWNNEKIILFVGRLIANKGLHSIIAALPEILANQVNTRLIIVGHGPQREQLETLIWALQNGHSDLVLNLVNWGRELEGDGESAWQEIQLYFNHLKKHDKLTPYFKKAQKHLKQDSVIFTGYLTHKELCHLFPACDVAIFPSIVAEAGPLVFLEAMASACFPIGTYFAGMAASIDSVADALPQNVVDLMKISPRPEQTVMDIIAKTKGALSVDRYYKEKLRRIAIEKYDWKNISKVLASDLHRLQTLVKR
ncbi:glycosyltransferase [Desulfotalea psychrophila]|uniref:Related to hexosyltransferase n=1 Tax=Desulfotalea psychrophila (strain LSv54 / DSM 12343) TaxID=177439 RepID=Q6ARI7_DESPS|nr:glycosyltransferase [Desulfotalea psychrophila]CAG35038.1 related to hexosyltransferase [Desulfotalea psychrophila LSv54]